MESLTLTWGRECERERGEEAGMRLCLYRGGSAGLGGDREGQMDCGSFSSGL